MRLEDRSVSLLRTRVTLLVLIAGLVVVACDPGSSEPVASEIVPEIDPEQLGMLDRLGYVDFGTRTDEHTGVTIHDTDRTAPGVNLVTYSAFGRAELIDAEGRLLHVWEAASETQRWEGARILADGDLLVVSRPGGLMRMSPDGAVRWVWDREHHHFHHFADELPDGRLVGVALTRRWRLGYSKWRVVDDSVATLSPEGELLERHFLLDVARRNPGRGLADEPVRPGTTTRKTVDLFHVNRVDWITDDTLEEPHALMRPGRVLLTVRNQDSLVLLDWSSQEIHWMFGRGVLGKPHDAQVLPNGHVVVIDNVGLDAGSRVVEIDPLRDEIVWEYRSEDPSDFFTKTRGTVQRLPGGTTLVAESNEGRAFEITREGEIVWEYRTPHRDDEGHPAALRIARYPESVLARLDLASADAGD